MLKEIVSTILPNTWTLKCKCYTNPANIIKKQSAKTNEETYKVIEKYSPCVDNAETHALKRTNFNVSTLISIFIFYMCIVNVIILCDDSVRNVNSKIRKGPYAYVREKSVNWYENTREVYGNFQKNLQNDITSAKRQSDDEKSGRYGAVAREVSYDYYRNKDDIVNASDYPEFHEIPNYMPDDSQAAGHPHDLASYPYYVKNIQFNLRPERHLFKKKVVKLGVLLPADSNHIFSLAKVLPILELAVPAVTRLDGPLPGWTVLVDYRDTRCSSVEGPLAAFEFYVHESAGKTSYYGCSKQYYASLLKFKIIFIAKNIFI